MIVPRLCFIVPCVHICWRGIANLSSVLRAIRGGGLFCAGGPSSIVHQTVSRIRIVFLSQMFTKSLVIGFLGPQGPLIEPSIPSVRPVRNNFPSSPSVPSPLVTPLSPWWPPRHEICPKFYTLVTSQTWELSQILHRRNFRLKLLHRLFHLI